MQAEAIRFPTGPKIFRMGGEIRPASIFNTSLTRKFSTSLRKMFLFARLLALHSNLSSRDRTLPFIMERIQSALRFLDTLYDRWRARARAFYVETTEILAEMRAICGRVVFNNSLISLAVVRARNFPISVLVQTSLIKCGEILGD